MTLAPPDLLLDVARAADPNRARAAAQRLVDLAANDTGGFEPALAVAHPPASPAPPSTSHFTPAPPATSAAPDGAAYRRFEGVVLKSFIEAMLPGHADSVFGGGFAGGVWKSFLAETLGTQLASRGGIGIADQIEKGAKRRSAPPPASS